MRRGHLHGPAGGDQPQGDGWLAAGLRGEGARSNEAQVGKPGEVRGTPPFITSLPGVDRPLS